MIHRRANSPDDVNLLFDCAVPQADGVFLTDNRESRCLCLLKVRITKAWFHGIAQKLSAQGQYSRIPMVTGDMNDEGTIFSLTSANVTTEDQFRTYVHENYVPLATEDEISQLAGFYPQDPTQGSPFDTGYLNQLTRESHNTSRPILAADFENCAAQYKRLAALGGDLVFQSTRRYFLSFTSKTQSTWAYIFKRGTNIPFLGAYVLAYFLDCKILMLILMLLSSFFDIYQIPCL